MRMIFVILSLLFLGACNSRNSDVNPDSLSYDFNINRTCTGRFCKPDDNEVCRTTQSFTSQAAYCDGLRNSKLNKGCARRDRKAQYFAKCGPSFEDLDIEGWAVTCGPEDSDRSSQDLFPDRKSYCADLSAAEHSSCSTSLRNELAERFECGR